MQPCLIFLPAICVRQHGQSVKFELRSVPVPKLVISLCADRYIRVAGRSCTVSIVYAKVHVYPKARLCTDRAILPLRYIGGRG
jgi:hypothetical protein